MTAMPPVVALSLAANSNANTGRLRLPTSSSNPSLASLASACAKNGGGVLPLTTLGVVLASSGPSSRMRMPLVGDRCELPRRVVGREWSGGDRRPNGGEQGQGGDAKRVVDKTNPFIGYFQQSQADARTRKMERRSKLAAIPEQGWRRHAPSPKWTTKTIANESKHRDIEEERDVTWMGRYNDATASEQGSCSSERTITAETVSSGLESTSLRLEVPTSRFEQDFQVICSIGEGGQGSVFKVRSRLDGCEYAVKKVVLPKGAKRDSAVVQQALREVRAMALMPCHPHVVRYHTAWLEEVDESGSDDEEKNKDSKRGDAERMQSKIGCVEFSSFRDDVSMESFLSFEGSMGGFEFAEPSRSSTMEDDDDQKVATTMTHLAVVHEEPREDESVSSQSSEREATLVLYIQMELCLMPSSMRNNSELEDEAGDSFHRFVDRVSKMPETPNGAANRSRDNGMVHPSFSSWLRGSVDARSAPETAISKHKEGLRLYLEILDGVQHMHKCGVIHRDLKPENVFLHGHTAKIGDFGLSKSIYSECCESLAHAKQQGATPDGEAHTTALGTFTYASPEQLGNAYQHDNTSSAHRVMKIARYSFKSDIFALGVILLELCCPCKTMMERSQVLTAVRHGVVPQRTVARHPVEMALVLRMTAIDPAERPSADEVIEQLQPLVDGYVDPTSAHAILADLRDLQQRFSIAAHQLCDRSQSAQHLDALATELNEKVQSLSVALM